MSTLIHPNYYLIDLKRMIRDGGNTMFIIGIPVLMYLIFGSTAESNDPALHANVQFYVMQSMAVYGAVSAVVGISGSAVLESIQGWSRQLGLTPLANAGYVATKVAVALTYSLIVVIILFIIGAFTGARADSIGIWISSAVLAWLLSTIFALYGIAVGLSVKSQSGASIATGFIIVLSFFGNLFVPLGGIMLQIARFTPMYGVAGLARWPQLRGHQVGPEGMLTSDPLWSLVLNVVIWAAIFAVVAIFAVRKGRARR